MSVPESNLPTKTKAVDAWVSAEVHAAGTHYGAAVEIPRGAVVKSVHLDVTLGGDNSDEDYLFEMQGRSGPDRSWADIPSILFTQQTNLTTDTAVSERMPSAANLPGLIVPRYVRSKVLTAGTNPEITGGMYVEYTVPNGPGKPVDHGVVS